MRSHNDTGGKPDAPAVYLFHRWMYTRSPCARMVQPSLLSLGASRQSACRWPTDVAPARSTFLDKSRYLWRPRRVLAVDGWLRQQFHGETGAVKRDVEKARAWQRRSKPLNARSPKQRVKDEAHAEMRLQVLAEEPWCLVGGPHCTRQSTNAHHLLKRSGGGGNVRANYRGVCHNCHDFIHDHSEWAVANGWLIRSNREAA